MPLAFGAILLGVVLTIAGVTGSTIPSVAKGAPDHASAEASTASSSTPTAGGGATSSTPAAGGSWQAELQKLAKEKGWNASAWEQIIQKESSGNPAAVNSSSGAFGLGQFLGATKAEYAKYGSESTNPVEQIKADAKYIEDRYHNPTNALAFHNANGWY
jgi:soluble lytic murein transglycosylase-like protein